MKTKVYKPNKFNPIAKAMFKDRRVSIIVENFHGVDWHAKTKKFPVFVVYDSPEDFPGKFTVRLFFGEQPTRLVAVKDSLEEARKTIPDIYIPVQRSESDIPAIVETWL